MLQEIKEKLSSWIDGTKSPQEINQFLHQIDLSHYKPQQFFNQLDLSDVHEPTLVYVDLMVQDMRQPQYYYSCLIQRPINKNSHISLSKYGINNDEQMMEKSQSQEFTKIISSRQHIICTPCPYETEWMKRWKKENKHLKHVSMLVEGKNEFKLGEQFCGVCFLEPKSQRLYFIRLMEEEQKKKIRWLQNIWQLEINFQKTKQILMEILKKVCEESYAYLLMFSMISEKSMFISGIGSQVIPILHQILPRVCHLQVKVPFKLSYFPYKNNEGQLIQTPMQLSQEKTFTILDFSFFSEQKQTKIQQSEIDNLKALKVFVEEGQTVYRWEYGESLIDHCHSGLIIKAAQIIQPNFKLKNSEFKAEKEDPFEKINEQERDLIRGYIEKCRKLKPVLSEVGRKQIEEYLKQKKEKLNLHRIMELARLNAMSEGRQIMEMKDFMKGKELESCLI